MQLLISTELCHSGSNCNFLDALFKAITDTYLILNNMKKRGYIAILVIAVLGVYISTLLRGIGYSGDTTKFQFVGKVLGTAHEPGSPGYTILNYCFVTLFPWGSYSFKANLLSAVFATAAIIVLFFLLQKLSVRRSVAFFTSLIFAFTYTLWSQSVIAEVYTLNILFVGLTLFFFIKWHQTLRQRDFFIGCTIYALSFGTHLSMITFLPALLFLVWKTRKEYFFNIRIVICILGIIAIGAAQYGYLFWRTYAQDTTYLEIAVTNLKDLWYYVRGGQFQDKLMDSSLNKAFYIRMPFMMHLAWLEYSLLLPVCILGFVVIRNSSLRIFLILCAMATFVFACLYGISDIFIYMLPLYFILALTLGNSLEWFANRCIKRYLVLFQIFLACTSCIFLSLNYIKADQSGNMHAKTLVEQSLMSLGRKSFIVCPDYDWAEYFWYYVFAEGYQRDSVYVFYPHNTDISVESIESYLSHRKPFYLPVQRCYVPDGLNVYFCTATGVRGFNRSRARYPFADTLLRYVGDPTMRDMLKTGLQFTPVGIDMYRINKH